MIRTATIELGLAVLAGPALAQTGQQICAKMQTEDRLGPLTVVQCRCNHSVATQVLDDDIRSLLFDAWYNGNNNMAKLETLKPRSRVRKQLKTMANAVKKHCS